MEKQKLLGRLCVWKCGEKRMSTPRNSPSVVVLVALLFNAWLGTIVKAEHKPSAPVVSTRAMVSSAHPLASQAGLKIMQDGGNAFDAAVAVAAVLPLVEPGSSGLGGSGGAVFHLAATNEVKALSWFARSPVSPKFGERRRELRDPDSPVRMRPPGSLAGLAALLETHGSMSLEQVLAPAIHYAEQGVAVVPRMHRTVKSAATWLQRFPSAVETFLVNGEIPPVGGIVRYPDLARTMRLFAQKGPDVLYRGEVGEEIVTSIRELGGLIDWKDLELASQPTWHDKPLTTTYHGHTVYGLPQVGGGVELIIALNILEGFDLKGLSEAQRAHVFAEAFKLALIDRQNYLGDPAFVEIPLPRLISKAYAAQLKAKIRLEGVVEWSLLYPDPEPTDIKPVGGTTHFVVADEAGNVVSVTNSVGGLSSNWHIGRTGLIFAPNVSGMSLNPKHPNYAEPGKYQQMTMSPVIVHNQDGKPVLAVGAAGGHQIVQAIVQVIVNVIDRGLNVQEALDAPRVSYEPQASYDNSGTPLIVSPHFSEETVRVLKQLGHDITPGESATVQAIATHPVTGALMGATDPNADGPSAGY